MKFKFLFFGILVLFLISCNDDELRSNFKTVITYSNGDKDTLIIEADVNVGPHMVDGCVYNSTAYPVRCNVRSIEILK